MRLSHDELVPGDDLVPDDAQGRAGDAEGDVGGAAVVDELADALVPGEAGAGPDDDGDPDPGEVLGPVQAVGIPLRRPPAREAEAQEDHGAGRDVGQVVDRVAEQPDRPGQDREQQFDHAGHGQPDRADRDGPVGLPAFVHVIAGNGQRERGSRVAHAGGLVHPASMARVPSARQIHPQVRWVAVSGW